MDQLAATAIKFKVQGMLGNGLPCIVDPPNKPPNKRRDNSEDDNGGDLEGEGIIAEVQLAQVASAYLMNISFYILLTVYSSKARS